MDDFFCQLGSAGAEPRIVECAAPRPSSGECGVLHLLCVRGALSGWRWRRGRLKARVTKTQYRRCGNRRTADLVERAVLRVARDGKGAFFVPADGVDRGMVADCLERARRGGVLKEFTLERNKLVVIA